MAVAENRQLAMPADDLLLPFQTVQSGVTGRIVRLGSVVDTILSRHAYPEPVSHALGEALAADPNQSAACGPRNPASRAIGANSRITPSRGLSVVFAPPPCSNVPG